MSLLARCPSCVKTYRVPHDRKEWHCKACKGVLELESETTAPDLPEGETCPGCGAISFDAQAFCEECGQALGSHAGEQTRRPRRKDERQASAEMILAFKKLSRLKTFLTFNLWMSFVAGLFYVPALMDETLTLGVKSVTVLVVAASIGLAYAAVRLVESRPFPLVMTLAGLQTLGVIWDSIERSPTVFGVVWAIVLWMLAVDAAQVTRLARQYPDLYLSRRMRGEHLRSSGKPGRRRTVTAHETDRDQSVAELQRSREDSSRARRIAESHDRANMRQRKRLLLAGTLAALVFAVYTINSRINAGSSQTRASPRTANLPSPDAAIERFRLAWNAGDIPAMVAEAKPSLASKLERALMSFGARYDWGTQFPPLGQAEWDEPTYSTLRVYYSTEVGDFPVRFAMEDGHWVLRTITTSEIKDWRPE